MTFKRATLPNQSIAAEPTWFKSHRLAHFGREEHDAVFKNQNIPFALLSFPLRLVRACLVTTGHCGQRIGGGPEQRKNAFSDLF